jgi:cytochrome c oxidase subunit 1
MAAAQLLFIANFFGSMFAGRRAPANPWNANTLEWTTASPPPHGNFQIPPVVYRGPYEYSNPAATADFWPQSATHTA